MTLKRKKCFFFGNKIDHLGPVKKRGKLLILDKATDVICELKQTTNLTELK